MNESKKRGKEAEKITSLIESNKKNKELMNQNLDKIDSFVKKADSINIDQDFKVCFEMKSSKNQKESNIFNEKYESMKKVNEENEILANLLQKKRFGSNLDRIIKQTDNNYLTQETEELNHENSMNKIEIQALNEDDPWVYPNLIVRIKDKDLKNGEFFNKKAKIIHIIDEFVAEIEVIDNNAKMKIDQLLLEPVIPAINSNILILCGENRWKKGKLLEINLKEKFVTVEYNNKQFYIEIKGICKI